LGLTNWSAETFPIALERFSFFKLFDGIVVSGEEKLIKPDKAIFNLLLNRYTIKAIESIFIDDNINNIKAADALGFQTIHIHNKMNLETELIKRKIL
jgi:2-haloacid dehalogenase